MKKLIRLALVLLAVSFCVTTIAGCNPFAPGQVKKEARKDY